MYMYIYVSVNICIYTFMNDSKIILVVLLKDVIGTPHNRRRGELAADMVLRRAGQRVLLVAEQTETHKPAQAQTWPWLEPFLVRTSKLVP